MPVAVCENVQNGSVQRRSNAVVLTTATGESSGRITGAGATGVSGVDRRAQPVKVDIETTQRSKRKIRIIIIKK